MPKYWLMKSEPNAYSIDDLQRDRSTFWDGVRNYQARNYMKNEMHSGDRVLFYHSNVNPPGVAGIARVVEEASPDLTAVDPKEIHFDPKATPESPRWYGVEIEFEEKFEQLVPLETLGRTEGLEQMIVNKRSRLSVQPVTPEEFEIVCRLGREREL